MTGVYEIKNRISGWRYIGEAVNIKDRWQRHHRDLEHHKHHCDKLQKAWKRTPSFAFKFRVKEIFLFTNYFVNRDKLVLMLLLREGYYCRREDLLYNTEDTLSHLKTFALTGKFEGRFKRYKHYKRWIRRRLVFSRRWMPHILIAAQYNYAVRYCLYVAGGVGLWKIYSILDYMLQ